ICVSSSTDLKPPCCLRNSTIASAFALPMPFSWVSSAAVAVLRLILVSVGSAAPASRLTDNNAAANRCLIHCMITLLSSGGIRKLAMPPHDKNPQIFAFSDRRLTAGWLSELLLRHEITHRGCLYPGVKKPGKPGFSG